jgi:flagellin FlaB
MKAAKYFLKNQHGMTGLETAIILIAFVTVAAVFGYAILSAGLFSAEQGKSAVYAGLNEAKSNLELSGSVMAKSDDSVNVRSILFTVKNAIAGNPIDMTPNNGSGKNKCVISLTTASDYINDVKWSKTAIGADNGNNLLETGEQFEITVDLTNLGSAGSLSENLTANQKFSLQVKPALGSTITIQRTLPSAIGPVMDLDLMTSFGGGRNGGGATQQTISVNHLTLAFGTVLVGVTSNAQGVTVSNTGTANLSVGTITLGGANANQFAIGSDTASNQTIAAGASRSVVITFDPTSTGAKSANLSIPSNDPVNNPVTVALSGTGDDGSGILGIDAGQGVTAWSADGAVYSVGFQIDNPSGGQPVDLASDYAQGHQTTAVTLTTPEAGTISNPDWFADDMNGNCGTTMQPGTWCSLVVYTPSSPALQASDTFTITFTPQGGATLTVTRTLPSVIPPTGTHLIALH